MIPRGHHAFIAIVVATVLAAVVGGLFLLGSPQKARERGLDARRIADIRAIASVVDLYWTRQGRLPPSLGDLPREQGLRANFLDPETGRPYDYRVLGEDSYELCAEFASEAAEESHISPGDYWAHGSGRQCFRLEPKAIKR